MSKTKNMKFYTTISLVMMLCGILGTTPVIVSQSNFTMRNYGTLVPILPLHIEGRYIKDSGGNTIYLGGVGKIHWDDDPTGWWVPQGRAWQEGYLTWNETVVRYHLRTMKRSWGLNTVRFHTVADWWIQDNVTLKTYAGSYRGNLERTIQIAAEEGIYVIFDLFAPMDGAWMYAYGYLPPGIPFEPYLNRPEEEAVFPNKQAFVDYWASVATELRFYSNVLFELYNEPNAETANTLGFDTATARNDWFDAVQKAITAIRNAGAENIVMVQWHYGAVPYMGWQSPNAGDLTWVEAYPLNDPKGNILYSTHLYRTYYNPNWGPGYDYNYTLAAMENCKMRYVLENLAKPLIIGEIGVNMWSDNVTRDASGLTSLEKELKWATNVFRISNDWGISYSAWDWMIRVDTWYLLSNTNNNPSAWGQVLIDAVRAR